MPAVDTERGIGKKVNRKDGEIKPNRRKWLLNFKVHFSINLYSSTPGGKAKIFSKLKQKSRTNLESD